MRKYIYIIIAVLFVVGVIWLIQTPGKAGIYDDFAKCLGEKGATFYGTFWCPHCQSQKADFGSSAKYLPYIECSTPDGQGQTKVCSDAGVTNYPTWQFNASSTDRLIGEQALEILAERTGCQLPLN